MRALLMLGVFVMVSSCVGGAPVPCTECGGSCVDLKTDSANCGSCSKACDATSACVAGQCKSLGKDSCTAPLVECAGACADPRTDPANCGACGTACAATNVDAPLCVASACSYGACTAGFLDCDANKVNGCELACAPAHVGAAKCSAAMGCDYTECVTGFADCDGVRSNGCEKSLDDVNSCGACVSLCLPQNVRIYVDAGSGDAGTLDAGTPDAGTVDAGSVDAGPVDAGTPCGQTADGGDAGACPPPVPPLGSTCFSGRCGYEQCQPGFGDCDRLTQNGCEADLNDNANCGACGVVCNGRCFQGRCQKRVFLTSDPVLSGFGSAQAGDAICQQRATNARLEGTFKAWLSSNGGSPLQRFTQYSGQYVRLDGVVIADNWADLIDGTLDNPINVTEINTVISPAEVWTGASANGTGTGANCGNWTNTMQTAPFATVGLSSRTNGNWSSEYAQTCERNNVRFYCFEQ